jgi:rRNA maturation RNase YbeY
VSKIDFVFEDTDPFDLDNAAISEWIAKTIRTEHYDLSHINFIFCSDKYLLRINQDYLNHDYYTDIITFDNSDSEKEVESDIFISIDRVRENAGKENATFMNELLRVCVHGVLHLCGYKDHSEQEKLMMRSKEDAYLSLYDK